MIGSLLDRMTLLALPLAALLTLAPAIGRAADRPEKAVCIVCHVEEGTTAPESVHASRTHKGVEYHFCSERCADKFAKDPDRFVAAAARIGGRADSTASGFLFPRFSTAPT